MPRIVTARQIGLVFENRFGSLGPERFVTGHHTAGRKDKGWQDAAALARIYHRDHAAKGWGGIGYHFMIARDGTILCLRPTILKGAHVGGWNSENLGIVCNGTTGDRPTLRQMRSLRWLLRNAHTTKVPKAHRADVSLTRAKVRVHNEWSGHSSNACAGTHIRFFKSRGTKR